MRPLLPAVAFLLLVLASVEGQTRPRISEQFSAKIQTVFKERGHTYTTSGDWAHDFEGQKQVQNVELTSGQVGPTLDEIRLFLYKEHVYYYAKFEEEVVDSCEKHMLNSSMPAFWTWVNLAAYSGTKTYDGHILQVWLHRTATVSQEVGVRSIAPNIPVFYAINTTSAITHSELTMVVESFTPTTPPPDAFTVPDSCFPHPRGRHVV